MGVNPIQNQTWNHHQTNNQTTLFDNSLFCSSRSTRKKMELSSFWQRATTTPSTIVAFILLGSFGWPRRYLMPQCVFQLLCVIHCFGTLVNWVNIVDAMLPCHASNLSPFHTGRGRPSSRLRSLRGNRDYFDERLSQVQIRHSGVPRPFRAHSSGITTMRRLNRESFGGYPRDLLLC